MTNISIKNIKPHTWISLVMVIIALLNYVLTAMGKPIINIGEDQITYVVNTVMNLAFIIYPAWKNNSVTDNAQMTDEVLYMLRDGKISKDELETFIANHKSDEVPVD